MKSAGICIGSSSIQYVILQQEANNEFLILKADSIFHKGNPKEILLSLFLTDELKSVERIVITGRGYRKDIGIFSISEPEAIEYALSSYREARPNIIVSLGANNLFVYKISSGGAIQSVHTGNKCASGTGEFFMQQIKRMNINIEDVSTFKCTDDIYKVAGRCSVFCKSDCTHALNKGVPKPNLLSGLCVMIADKIDELVRELADSNIMLIGGGTNNKLLIEIIKKRYSNVIIPEKTASSFEAYGAAVAGFNIISAENNLKNLIINSDSLKSFSHLEQLNKSANLVKFKKSLISEIQENDETILGLDVGSTTTKAVLARYGTNEILASVYLRTNGNPIEASIECYKEIKAKTKEKKYKIIGLGVTGSGRQIAALHSLTKDVINEIIAHAAAAAFYDKDVDTIFEIGGQDAKYTYLVNGIPTDYAMNEACSAGTGSFLEESAGESLNVATTEIADYALSAEKPLNFSDQCSAFIASDITKAIQEGFTKNDILAGLVFSVCMNYVNRVKGARPIGKKIFMQGGVCYNKAVPYAMASLLNTEIIVPENAGLMGALGVAIEVSKKISTNVQLKQDYSLDLLINRKMEYGSTFICKGGKEKCDRKCSISRIKIEGEIYPFGGACNLYYNLRLGTTSAIPQYNLVAYREEMISNFHPKGNAPKETVKTIGILKSFLMHSYLPLFLSFFQNLGFNIVISDAYNSAEREKPEAPFCFPVEVSHSLFNNILKKNLDYIFLPQIITIPSHSHTQKGKTCVFVQGEPYYLKSTYRNMIKENRIKLLTPVLKLSNAKEELPTQLLKLSIFKSFSKDKVERAWFNAVATQNEIEKKVKDRVKESLMLLDNDPETFGIVIFGRPYNSLTSDMNMNIPHKVLTRNYMVLPYDMLPFDEIETDNMYWGMGQKILAAAEFVRKRKNLFAFFITNFSCGPDSFVLDYFRKTMGSKPSLTIELDQHTADAGVDTRIEAAVDIMKTFFINQNKLSNTDSLHFKKAKVVLGKNPHVISSSNETFPLFNSENVVLLIPPMGLLASESSAAAFRKRGINAQLLPQSDNDSMLLGKKHSSCKECLPYILTTGLFMDYLQRYKDPNKITLFLMGKADGPCRFGQYHVAFNNIIDKYKIENCALLTFNDNDNVYKILGQDFVINAWRGLVVADVFADIRNMLRITAQNKEYAMRVFDLCWNRIIKTIEGKSRAKFSYVLNSVVKKLKAIPLSKNPKDVPIITVVGEIYVRSDEFSRGRLISYLEENGFCAHVAPISEWANYCCYVIKKEFDSPMKRLPKLGLTIGTYIQDKIEKKIKLKMSECGLYSFKLNNVEDTINASKHLISEHLLGEAVLTVGLAMHEILERSCGVISIGPFGCMPSRLSESILKKEMTLDGKLRASSHFLKNEFPEIDSSLPFLSIETDGAPFPQHVEANLEAFLLQASRLNLKLKSRINKE